MTTTRVLAVDPGKASGVAIIDRADGELHLTYADELDFPAFVRTIPHLITPGIGLVAEKFTITARTAQLSQAPWSLEVIGAFRAQILIITAEDTLVLQKPSDAKSFVTNEHIKAMGLWHKGGAGHALDAIRHGVLWHASHGFVPDSLIASKTK